MIKHTDDTKIMIKMIIRIIHDYMYIAKDNNFYTHVYYNTV